MTACLILNVIGSAVVPEGVVYNEIANSRFLSTHQHHAVRGGACEVLDVESLWRHL